MDDGEGKSPSKSSKDGSVASVDLEAVESGRGPRMYSRHTATGRWVCACARP